MQLYPKEKKLYWQAKIWALLHDPVFKPFLRYKNQEGTLWQDLKVMEDVNPLLLNDESSLKKYIKNADYIASASDRAAIGNLGIPVNYEEETGLILSHLLSGAPQPWKIEDKIGELIDKEQKLELIPDFIKAATDPKKVFWWLWRCLPTEVCKQDGNKTSLLLMPADTRIPDTSLWSHSSMTAALAGAAIGCDTTLKEFSAVPPRDLYYKYYSHPYLVSFSFAPVQDLIKSSRKMRDFWAGSWILHYLSAKVSWELARIYGADCLLYPSLFHQPLIDKWLLKQYPDFNEWIKVPTTESLLTAGFPNVLVLVLPEKEVNSAMQTAKQYLQKTWLELGNDVFNYLSSDRANNWTRQLKIDANSWNGWLKHQWQIYWTGIPIGKKGEGFKQSQNNEKKYFSEWLKKQNDTYQLKNPQPKPDREQDNIRLFTPAELQLFKHHPNIGSWWGYIFDTNRLSLTSIKNARNWQIPTVFSTRSTISGLGAAVHDKPKDWGKEGNIPTEGEVKKFWKHQAGLFNGSEQLNATEVVKRGLHKVLPNLLNLQQDELTIAYPDLTCGVAGYLRTNGNT